MKIKSNILGFVFLLLMLCKPIYANSINIEEYIILAQHYYNKKDYTRSIEEYHKAIELSKDNNVSEIVKDLILSYYKYAETKFANKEYTTAIDNYKSAIFLINSFELHKNKKYARIRKNSNKNLKKCLKMVKFSTSLTNRYERAKNLMNDKKYAAAGYEYVLVSGDAKYKTDCYKQLIEINGKYKNIKEQNKYKNLITPFIINQKKPIPPKYRPILPFSNYKKIKFVGDIASNLTPTVDKKISTAPITTGDSIKSVEFKPQPILMPMSGINYHKNGDWEQYQNDIISVLKKNWQNDSIGQDYVVEVEVKVSNVGNLLSCNLIKSSNSSIIDKKAIKAVLSTYPFFSTDIQYEVEYNIKFDSKNGQIFISNPIYE